MENKHSYASPAIYRDEKTEFLVTHGGDFIIGHSLSDGSEIWRCGGFNPKSDYNPFLRFVASPVCVRGLIVVPTAKRGPVLALKPELKGDVTESSESLLWRADRVTPDVASPLIYDGRVYLARENGSLVCLDARTGNSLFEERLLADRHRSTPVAGDGKIYLAGRDGVVTIIAAAPELKVISRNDMGEVITASPAISGGKIFVRTFDALYAFGNAEN
jgi:outer membrane protein assembly factor BamB